MRVAIPHDLDKPTVRDRLKTRSHLLAEKIPGGMADVQSAWVSEDQLDLAIKAMGQTLAGKILVEDGQVVIEMDLPPALAFIEPIVEGAIRQQGQVLIGP